MALVSKTRVLDLQFTRAGAPFAMVAARTNIDAKNFDFSSSGAAFWGVSDDETITYTPLVIPAARNGAPYKEITARGDIDASGFDYCLKGAPFWVAYNGAPPPFNTTRFFLLF